MTTAATGYPQHHTPSPRLQQQHSQPRNGSKGLSHRRVSTTAAQTLTEASVGPSVRSIARAAKRTAFVERAEKRAALSLLKNGKWNPKQTFTKFVGGERLSRKQRKEQKAAWQHETRQKEKSLDISLQKRRDRKAQFREGYSSLATLNLVHWAERHPYTTPEVRAFFEEGHLDHCLKFVDEELCVMEKDLVSFEEKVNNLRETSLREDVFLLEAAGLIDRAEDLISEVNSGRAEQALGQVRPVLNELKKLINQGYSTFFAKEGVSSDEAKEDENWVSNLSIKALEEALRNWPNVLTNGQLKGFEDLEDKDVFIHLMDRFSCLNLCVKNELALLQPSDRELLEEAERARGYFQYFKELENELTKKQQSYLHRVADQMGKLGQVKGALQSAADLYMAEEVHSDLSHELDSVGSKACDFASKIDRKSHRLNRK